MEEEFKFNKKKQADNNTEITPSTDSTSDLVGMADAAKNPEPTIVSEPEPVQEPVVTPEPKPTVQESVQEPIEQNPYLKQKVPTKSVPEPTQESTVQKTAAEQIPVVAPEPEPIPVPEPEPSPVPEPEPIVQEPVQESVVEPPTAEPIPEPEPIVELTPVVEPEPPVQVEPAVAPKTEPEPIVQEPVPEPILPKEPTIVGFRKEETPKVKIKTNNPDLMNDDFNVRVDNPELVKKEFAPIQPDVPVMISNMPPKVDSQETVNGKKPIDYSVERVSTGIVGFDELIGGGFEKDSTVLVDGAVGTGKTLLGLQFLYKGIVEEGEPGMFISFEEDRESLYKHAKQFGWDFEKYEAEGKFRLLEFKPHQMTKIIEEGGGSVRDMLKEIGAKRVVVDSITAYGLLFHDEYTRRDKVLEFLNSLKKWDVTAIVISEESPDEIESKTGSIGFITDAIISLYYQHDEEKGIRIHSLEVIKMRGSQHTNKLCAMNFEKDGIRVYPDIEVF